MARSAYQYETSPRKIQPNYKPTYKPERTTGKSKIYREEKEEQEKNRKIALKYEKKRMIKKVAMIVGLFLVLLAVSYRNSLITQKFNQVQNKKNELAAIQKTNGQLEVAIESSLNLSNVEKIATEKIGMQKLSNNQKVLVTLPKKDYTESATKEIMEENNSNWFENLINSLFK